MTVQDAEVAQKVWGKTIAELKGKTTSEKSECSGQVSNEDPYRIYKLAQGSLPHMRHILWIKYHYS